MVIKHFLSETGVRNMLGTVLLFLASLAPICAGSLQSADQLPEYQEVAFEVDPPYLHLNPYLHLIRCHRRIHSSRTMMSAVITLANTTYNEVSCDIFGLITGWFLSGTRLNYILTQYISSKKCPDLITS